MDFMELRSSIEQFFRGGGLEDTQGTRPAPSFH